MSYIAIEGLIGAGKSTLAKWVSKKLSWNFLPEPVEENPMLPFFYQDPKRWAFQMQIYMLHTRYRQQQVAGHSHIPCVLDRSLPGDRCFAKLQTKYGNMHEMEWKVYEECYRTMSMVRPPFLFIFLDVTPETAMERIKERNRGVESGISLNYLHDLNQEYQELVTRIEQGSTSWSRGITIKRIPWDKPYKNLDNSPAIDMLGLIRSYLDHDVENG